MQNCLNYIGEYEKSGTCLYHQGRLDGVLLDLLLEVHMHPGVAFINISPLTMN